jgi:hypothetical protein
MSDYGIKMSKPGVDVKTADDVDLSWSSDFKTFKIFRVVKLEAGQNTNHGLNYAPSFLALSPGDFWYDFCPVSVDNTKVYSNLSGKDVYIILFIDPLNE